MIHSLFTLTIFYFKPSHILCYAFAHYVLALRTSCVEHHHPFSQCLPLSFLSLFLSNFIPLLQPLFHLLFSKFASLPLSGRAGVGLPLLPPRPMIEVYILSHKQVDRHIVNWFNLLFQHDSTEEGVNTEVALLVSMLCDEERYTPFS